MRSGQPRGPHTTLGCVSPTSSRSPRGPGRPCRSAAGGREGGLSSRRQWAGQGGSWPLAQTLFSPACRFQRRPHPTFQELPSACSPRHIHPHTSHTHPHLPTFKILIPTAPHLPPSPHTLIPTLAHPPLPEALHDICVCVSKPCPAITVCLNNPGLLLLGVGHCFGAQVDKRGLPLPRGTCMPGPALPRALSCHRIWPLGLCFPCTVCNSGSSPGLPTWAVTSRH